MSKRYMRSFAVSSLLAFSGSANAQVDPTEIVIPYSSASNRTIGDAINIDFPNAAIGRCVDYSNDDIKWDNEGAISSDGSVQILSDYTREKEEVDLDLGLKASGKIKAGVFNANTALDATFHTNRIRANDDRSISIVFHSSADYGRRMIEDYKVKDGGPSVEPLPAYRAICGTHFIRGQRRASELAIFVEITTSSRSGKDALNASLSRTIGGGASLKAFSGEGSATVTAAYKSIIEFARESGTVHVEYSALGGPGIKAAGDAAKITDPADLVKLSQIASDVAGLFTQANSSVTGYVLQSNTAIGAPPFDFDLERTKKIGSLVRALIKVSDASTRYDDLRKKAPLVFQSYFSEQASGITALKASLVDKINQCASGKPCSEIQGEVLEHYLFLEDMFKDPKVALSCQYQKVSTLDPKGPVTPGELEVLETISVNVFGSVPHYDVIDFSSLKLKRLDAQFVVSDITPTFSGFSFSNPDRKGERRASGTVFSDSMRSRDLVSFNSTTKRFDIDVVELTRRREAVLDSAISLSAPGPAGYKISYTIGYPPRDGCPLTR
jgi:hypothetical protein